MLFLLVFIEPPKNFRYETNIREVPGLLQKRGFGVFGRQPVGPPLIREMIFHCSECLHRLHDVLTLPMH